jgi:hypothetical protein
MALKIFILSLMTINSLLLTSCTHEERTQKAEVIAVPEMPGNHYAALDFDEGEAKLSETHKRQLNNLAQKAIRDGREINEIKILAWADKEYPEKGERVSPRDAILAKERAQIVEEYLKKELHAKNSIETFNMAKRTRPISRIFKTDDWEVKESVERTGATATRTVDGQMSYTKASKALVIIDYETKKL